MSRTSASQVLGTPALTCGSLKKCQPGLESGVVGMPSKACPSGLQPGGADSGQVQQMTILTTKRDLREMPSLGIRGIRGECLDRGLDDDRFAYDSMSSPWTQPRRGPGRLLTSETPDCRLLARRAAWGSLKLKHTGDTEYSCFYLDLTATTVRMLAVRFESVARRDRV